MKIKLGQLKKVSNHKRKFGSALSYNAVYVEFDNGNTEALLLSDIEIADAIKRSDNNLEDIPKLHLPILKRIATYFNM